MKRDDRRRGADRRGARRAPPPEATGREQVWYRELAERAARVVVATVDGESFEGAVRAFDEAAIVVVADDGRRVRVRTTAIRSIAEA